MNEVVCGAESIIVRGAESFIVRGAESTIENKQIENPQGKIEYD